MTPEGVHAQACRGRRAAVCLPVSPTVSDTQTLGKGYLLLLTQTHTLLISLVTSCPFKAALDIQFNLISPGRVEESEERTSVSLALVSSTAVLAPWV